MASHPIVLLVDDDPDFLDLLDAYVSNAGYGVVKASGAFQAMEILEREAPDAMILDIMMPDRTGVELLEHLRWTPQHTDLPVICISAVTMTREALDFIREFSLGLVGKQNISEILFHLKAVLPVDGNG